MASSSFHPRLSHQILVVPVPVLQKGKQKYPTLITPVLPITSPSKVSQRLHELETGSVAVEETR